MILWISLGLVLCTIPLCGGYVSPQVSLSQVEALQDLYSSTHGEFWTWRQPESTYGKVWNFSTSVVNPCDNWQGVYCQSSSVDAGMQDISNITLVSFNMTGYIPPSISNISRLGSLIIRHNFIGGSIPATVCNLTTLSVLSAQFNLLTGTIPPCLHTNISTLTYISLEKNFLHGTLPPFRNLSSLSYISYSQNHLTGTLPISLYHLPLTSLFVSYNGFHGNLSEFDGWTEMQSISVSNNFFTGTLPASFNSFSLAHSLYVQVNLFTGTLPFLGNLSYLGYASFYLNQFTGPLPEYIGNWNVINVLELDTNYFSSSLPNIFYSTPALQQINLYENLFTGELPTSIGALSNLSIFLLQNNRFSGDLTSIFTSSSHNELQVLDIASNPFTGALPESIFKPSLLTFSTYRNCFSKRLPDSLCDASNLQTLLLDGLNNWCGSAIWPGIPGSPKRTTSIPGSLPACLFSLRNLTTLHVSGNGLSGSLPDLPGGYNRLRNLDVSYNLLTGSIPTSLQQWTLLENLNLQSNKLVGTIESMGTLNVTSPSFSISLSTNRLSGIIPLALGSAVNVDILEGNLFSCSWSHLPPANDPNANDFICGSSLVDDSLFAFLLIEGLIGALLLFATYSWTRAWARKEQGESEATVGPAQFLPGAKHTTLALPTEEGSTVVPSASSSFSGSDSPSSLQSNRPVIPTSQKCEGGSCEDGKAREPDGNPSSLPSATCAAGGVSSTASSASLNVLHAMWQLVQHCDHDDIAQVHAIYLRDHPPQSSSSSSSSPSLYSSLNSSVSALHLLCLTVLLYHSKLSQVVAQARHHPQLSNLVQFTVSIKTISRLAVLLMLLLLLVALPLFVWLKNDYRTYTMQYRWEYSALFLSGQVPSWALIVLWAGLLSVTLFQIVSNVPGIEADGQRGEESATVDKDEGGTGGCLSPTNRARDSTLVANPPRATAKDAATESGDSASPTPSHAPRRTLTHHSLHSRTTFIVVRSWQTVSRQATEVLTTARNRSFWVAVTTLLCSTIVVLAIKGGFIFMLVAANVPFIVKLVLEALVGGLDIMISAALIPYFINHVPSLTSLSKLYLKLSLLIINSLLSSTVAIMVADTSCFQSIFIPIKTVTETVTYTLCEPSVISTSLLATDRSFPSSPLSSLVPDLFSHSHFTWAGDLHHALDSFRGHASPRADGSREDAAPHGSVEPTRQTGRAPSSGHDVHSTGWGQASWMHLRRQAAVGDDHDASGGDTDACPYSGEMQGTSTLVASYQPSFTYTYNCYSAVGRGYVPIFFIIYTLLSVAVPGGMLLLARSTQLQSVHALFPAILFVDGEESSGTLPPGQEAPTAYSPRNPIHGDEVSVDSQSSRPGSGPQTSRSASLPTTDTPRQLLFPAFILASSIHHILVMLTFGLLFPLLAISAAMVVCITAFSWEVIIGRWLWLSMHSSKHASGSPEGSASFSSSSSARNCVCPQTLQLDAACAQVCHGPRVTLGILAFGSAAFIGLAAMDMAGDQVGWRGALYAPLTCFSFALAAWLFFNRTQVARVYHTQTARMSEAVGGWRESWRSPSLVAGPDFWAGQLARTSTWQERGAARDLRCGSPSDAGVELRPSAASTAAAQPLE